MAVGTAVVMAAGTAVSMYGAHKASKAEQAAMAERARAKNLQADKLLERFEINKESLKMKGHAFEGSQAAQFAKGGVSVSSGSPLLAMEETYRAVQREIGIQEKEVNDKAELLRMGADLDMQLRGDIASAEGYQQTGMFLSGAASATTMARKG